MQGRRAEAVERSKTIQEETAGIDDARMEQGMDRRWGVERIRQPHVQRELGRLAHGADEDQQRDGGGAADLEPAAQPEERKRGLIRRRPEKELRELQGPVEVVG